MIQVRAAVVAGVRNILPTTSSGNEIRVSPKERRLGITRGIVAQLPIRLAQEDERDGASNQITGLACRLQPSARRRELTPIQIRAARALLNWTTRQLGSAAGVHWNSVTNIETGRTAGAPQTLAAIRDALEAAGVELSNSGTTSGVSKEKAGLRTKPRLRYSLAKGVQSLEYIEVTHHKRQINSLDQGKFPETHNVHFFCKELIDSGATNPAGFGMTPGQCRAARALIGMSQKELAKRAKVGVVTIIKFEAGTRVPYPQTVGTIVRALNRAGVELTNKGGPGVRLTWASREGK